MNKKINELKNQLLSRQFNYGFSTDIKIKSNQDVEIHRDKSEEIKPPETQKKTLQLRIELDSWSPVYETFWGEPYKEKLHPDIFKDQGKIEELDLNSYVDHQIGIQHLIGSTRDNSMKVYRDGNTIFAELQESDDPLMQKVINLVERGVLKSNSFIFKALDVDVNEIKKDKETTSLEVVYTKGELISIDPVYAGFYPQDEVAILNSRDLNQINEVELEIETTESKDEVVETQEIENKEQEKMLNPNENLENDVVVEVSEATNEVVETNEAETTQEIKETVEARSAMNVNPIANQLAQPTKSIQTRSIEEIKSSWIRRDKLNEFEQSILLTEFDNLTRSQKDDLALQLDFRQDNHEGVRDFIKRSLDGTTAQKGLALIETLTNPKVIADMSIVFPELSASSTIMPLIGLNEVKQPIMIANSAKATSIAEGAPSSEVQNETTQCTFKPTRYSVFSKQNNQLNLYGPMMEKQTIILRNSILKALRDSFYTNMLVGIASALNKTAYLGGATQESVVQAAGTAVKFADLEIVYKQIADMWGDEVSSQYTISMHIDTLTDLEKEYFAQSSTLIKDIYNPITRMYRNIKINASSYYKQKNTTGQHPVIFYLKSAVYAYGCTMVTIDDRTSGISEDQSKRYVRTRGEIKMCDPNINTKVIKTR